MHDTLALSHTLTHLTTRCTLANKIHTQHMVQTHKQTHTEETYHSLSRTQIQEGRKDKRKKRGADKVSFRFVALHKHPDFYRWDTSTPTDSKIHKI